MTKPHGLTNPIDSFNFNPIVAKLICIRAFGVYRDDKEFTRSTVEYRATTG